MIIEQIFLESHFKRQAISQYFETKLFWRDKHAYIDISQYMHVFVELYKIINLVEYLSFGINHNESSSLTSFQFIEIISWDSNFM